MNIIWLIQEFSGNYNSGLIKANLFLIETHSISGTLKYERRFGYSSHHRLRFLDFVFNSNNYYIFLIYFKWSFQQAMKLMNVPHSAHLFIAQFAETMETVLLNLPPYAKLKL